MYPYRDSPDADGLPMANIFVPSGDTPYLVQYLFVVCVFVLVPSFFSTVPVTRISNVWLLGPYSTSPPKLMVTE